ncbi:YybH family protein [Kordiimonas lipolytica]|uniref:YybH family protein n=1 Tax=Kordiimonas lipolytica TaxID=1662421 RepID=A0ABV8UE38_9PROT|nr:nuclear transport factor 2 family protein [Kordiimonas lipolytica]
MMRLILSLWILLIFSAVPASADDRQEVVDLYESYRQIWLRNDSTVQPDIMALLTPRAAVMPQGMPLLGTHQQIRDFWFPADAPPTRVLAYDQSVERVEVSGGLAYLYGNFALSFKWDGETTSTQGTQMMVARRLGGDWKIEALIWTSSPVEEAD